MTQQVAPPRQQGANNSITALISRHMSLIIRPPPLVAPLIDPHPRVLPFRFNKTDGWLPEQNAPLLCVWILGNYHSIIIIHYDS